MTFSDSRVVKLLQNDFIPVWESVAPVKTVTFDLGEGRSFKGTVSGEIAVYFCTPEGKVFDILPALQSPAATLNAITEALRFYKEHDGKLGPEIVKPYHIARMKKMAGDRYDQETHSLGAFSFHAEMKKSALGLKKREDYINEAVDEATRDLRYMVASKVRAVDSSEPITIIEPGGRNYFSWEVSKRFATLRVMVIEHENLPLVTVRGEPLETPNDWKKELFEVILMQPLKGGEVTYDSSSLEAIRIIGE